MTIHISVVLGNVNGRRASEMPFPWLEYIYLSTASIIVVPTLCGQVLDGQETLKSISTTLSKMRVHYNGALQPQYRMVRNAHYINTIVLVYVQYTNMVFIYMIIVEKSKSSHHLRSILESSK